MIFTISRQVYTLSKPKTGAKEFVKTHEQSIRKANKVIISDYPSQDLFLYLHWLNDSVLVDKSIRSCSDVLHPDSVFLMVKKTSTDITDCDEPGQTDCYKGFCVCLD